MIYAVRLLTLLQPSDRVRTRSDGASAEKTVRTLDAFVQFENIYQHLRPCLGV